MADPPPPVDLTVTLSGPYYLNQLERLIRNLQPALALREATSIRIDLGGVTFMGPAALALTLATLSRLREGGLAAPGSVVTSPRSIGMHTYLERMDFYNVLIDGYELVNTVERHEHEGLRECRHFVQDEECRGVANDLADALAETVSTDEFARTSLQLCLTELTENVYYHANTALGGYAAAQPLKSTREIEVAIVDLGVGIADSLAKNPQYAEAAEDDVTAIRTATKPTVTATPERNSGYGLAFTRFLLETNSGRLLVRSGYGRVEYGEHPTAKREEYALPGTLVALRLHTDEPFDFQRAYKLLTRAINTILGTRHDDVIPTRAQAR